MGWVGGRGEGSCRCVTGFFNLRGRQTVKVTVRCVPEHVCGCVCVCVYSPHRCLLNHRCCNSVSCVQSVPSPPRPTCRFPQSCWRGIAPERSLGGPLALETPPEGRRNSAPHNQPSLLGNTARRQGLPDKHRGCQIST